MGVTPAVTNIKKLRANWYKGQFNTIQSSIFFNVAVQVPNQKCNRAQPPERSARGSSRHGECNPPTSPSPARLVDRGIRADQVCA